MFGFLVLGIQMITVSTLLHRQGGRDMLRICLLVIWFRTEWIPKNKKIVEGILRG